MSMDDKVKISVAVITYNQEKTIGQALDSILCQQGDFCLEVVIGEDCGTDSTRTICQEYVSRYPEIVTLLPNEKNLGIMANFAQVIKACTGDYVAILAGDDYWCDDHKLQKQLDYTLMHPECGVVCTNGYRLLVRSGKLVPGLPPRQPAPDGDIRDFYHDRYGGVYAMPLTLLIKRDLLQYVDFDEYIRLGFPVEDYPMQSVLAHHTCFGYLRDRTSVYRVYKESATFISYNHPRYMAYHRGLADIRRYLNKLYPDDVPFTEEWAADYVFYKEFLLYLHKGQYRKARKLVINAPSLIHQTPHFHNAHRAVKSGFHFAAFCLHKQIVARRDIKNRV